MNLAQVSSLLNLVSVNNLPSKSKQKSLASEQAPSLLAGCAKPRFFDRSGCYPVFFLFIWNTNACVWKISHAKKNTLNSCYSASDIICLSVNINCLLLMNNRPTSSVYGLNKRCLIGAFCRFLFNMIGWFRLQSICKFADLLQIIAADALQTFCRYSADILQTFCRQSADNL